MSWLCNHSESSERGDTCTKSNERDSFCNDLDSSSRIGCDVTTKDQIIRGEAGIDRFLQTSLDRVLHQLRKLGTLISPSPLEKIKLIFMNKNP